MNNKLKISTICALCAVVALPAMAAPSVRTLGGAGTYAGTQSATNARGTTTVGNSSINSVRMNNRAAGARTLSNSQMKVDKNKVWELYMSYPNIGLLALPCCG